mmetsp:Transcript_99263/g.285171  ORF Transcript_99263/g.285171 Transcript_99263/m.285171 type:complete len:265 (-) Transcript_99263:623-1417(-)
MAQGLGGSAGGAGGRPRRHARQSPSWMPQAPVEGAGEWVPRDNFNGRRGFGYFHCPCGRRWVTKHAFKEYRQGCQYCDSEVFAKYMWVSYETGVPREIIRRARGATSGATEVAERHHDFSRCEACRHGACRFVSDSGVIRGVAGAARGGVLESSGRDEAPNGTQTCSPEGAPLPTQTPPAGAAEVVAEAQPLVSPAPKATPRPPCSPLQGASGPHSISDEVDAMVDAAALFRGRACRKAPRACSCVSSWWGELLSGRSRSCGSW